MTDHNATNTAKPKTRRMDKHTRELAAYYRRVGMAPAKARELAKLNSASY